MTVEAATYIHELNPALPPNGDPLGEGDDHLRKVKLVIQNTLPNITGPVTATQATLNAVVPPSVANTALSGLTPAADKVPYFTGPAAAALATFTSWGRSVVAAVDQAAARTLLGLAALAFKATVATADIDADAVTFAKTQNIATGKLLGRTTASSGDIEEITPASKLSLSGGSLDAPGATILQTVVSKTTTSGSTSSVITLDDTKPQSSQGTATGLSAVFTPKSASSRILIEVRLHVGGATGEDLVGALFTSSSSDALSTGSMEGASSIPGEFSFDSDEASGSTAARTYSVRYGPGTGGTMYLNRGTAANYFGGTLTSIMKITEYI